MRTVFIHPERCVGCKQCEAACAVAHSQTKNLFLAVFESPLPKPRIHADPGLALNTAFPNKCRHCNPAPCQMVCPTAAIYRPVDYPEIVMIEGKKCIACGMCAVVCPFDVITYYPLLEAPGKVQVALKCDQCIALQRQGHIPACVEACKVGALEFGEMNELLKQARTRYSEQLTATLVAGIGHNGGELMKMPEQIDAWRGWGKAVTLLNIKPRKERER